MQLNTHTLVNENILTTGGLLTMEAYITIVNYLHDY